MGLAPPTTAPGAARARLLPRKEGRGRAASLPAYLGLFPQRPRLVTISSLDKPAVNKQAQAGVGLQGTLASGRQGWGAEPHWARGAASPGEQGRRGRGPSGRGRGACWLSPVTGTGPFSVPPSPADLAPSSPRRRLRQSKHGHRGRGSQSWGRADRGRLAQTGRLCWGLKAPARGRGEVGDSMKHPEVLGPRAATQYLRPCGQPFQAPSIQEAPSGRLEHQWAVRPHPPPVLEAGSFEVAGGQESPDALFVLALLSGPRATICTGPGAAPHGSFLRV